MKLPAARLVDEPFGCETCRRTQVESLRAERLKWTEILVEQVPRLLRMRIRVLWLVW